MCQNKHLSTDLSIFFHAHILRPTFLFYLSGSGSCLTETKCMTVQTKDVQISCLSLLNQNHQTATHIVLLSEYLSTEIRGLNLRV